jgi:YggT family protein
MVAQIISYFFLAYTVLLFVRIVGSWFPNIAHTTPIRFVAFYTDPYLNLFRRFIPPIGGVLDLSPLLAFFVLQILEQLLLFLVR